MGVSVGSLNQKQSVILRNISTDGDAAKKNQFAHVHGKCNIIFKGVKIFNNVHVYTVS